MPIYKHAILVIKQHRINNQIRETEVRLIDQNGENVGLVSIQEALNLAKEAGLDLVEVGAATKPSVCRIIDYNKYLYEQKSKLKKGKQKKTELKQFVFGPNIGEGDLRNRIDRGKEFLQNGNVVKYTVEMSGRQQAHPEFAYTKLKIVESELADTAKPSGEPKRNGKLISITFMPK